MAKLILLVGIAVILWLWWRGHSAGPHMTHEEARLLQLVRTGLAGVELFQAQHFGPAVLGETNCHRHVNSIARARRGPKRAS